MVVMETVRAATLATARRLERLATQADKVKNQETGVRRRKRQRSLCVFL